MAKKEQTERVPTHVFDAWALVRRKGYLAPVRVRVEVSEDLSSAEVLKVELLQEDYRAISEKKVAHHVSSHTPEWSR